jgi:hypothetical protein
LNGTSSQATAALYGVISFAILAAIYIGFVHFALGWPAIPETNRLQGTIMLGWYVIAGIFARNVGQHAARGATLGQAWRAALGDMGRGARKLIER